MKNNVCKWVQIVDSDRPIICIGLIDEFTDY